MWTRISVAPTMNSRARRTSPTDPASSSPGSFYVTALWSSSASSPTLSTHRTSPNTSDKPQRTQTHKICMHCNTTLWMDTAISSSGVYHQRAGKRMQSIKCVFYPSSRDIITWVDHTCIEKEKMFIWVTEE